MTEESPADVLRAYFDEVWNAHDLDRFDEFVAPDVKFHRPDGGVIGRDEWLAHVRSFMAGFPDIRISIEAAVEDGDTVAARITMSGTNTGERHGRPPTGKRMSVQGRPWARVRDGRIVEFWSLFDELGMLEQLGTAPAVGRAFGGKH